MLASMNLAYWDAIYASPGVTDFGCNNMSVFKSASSRWASCNFATGWRRYKSRFKFQLLFTLSGKSFAIGNILPCTSTLDSNTPKNREIYSIDFCQKAKIYDLLIGGKVAVMPWNHLPISSSSQKVMVSCLGIYASADLAKQYNRRHWPLLRQIFQ